MSSLAKAIEELPQSMHEALAKSARAALPFEICAHAHALATVPGSMEPYLSVNGAPDLPYANALAAVLGDLLPGGSLNSRPIWPLQEQANAGLGQEKGQQLPFNAPLWTSKVGGFGYLPKGFPYPTHTERKSPLQLLLQLNFSELYAQSKAVAKYLEDDSGKPVDPSSCYLPTPLWPTEGILALYVDCFDDCFGCSFTPRDPQNGYRMLYFPTDYEEHILPAIQRHLVNRDANASEGVTRLEAELSELMWTREEQFAVFNDHLTSDKEVLAHSWTRFGSTKTTDPVELAALDAERLQLCKEGWKLPYGTVTPTDHANTGAGVLRDPMTLPILASKRFKVPTRGVLWYGQPVKEEYTLGLNASRVLAEWAVLQNLVAKRPELLGAHRGSVAPLMAPWLSVEFNQLGLFRALRGPQGRELLADVTLCANNAVKRLAKYSKNPARWAERTTPPVGGDPLNEVNVRFVSSAELRTAKLERLKASLTAEGDEAELGTDSDDADADENTPCFVNHIGGFPTFTQEDPRYRAYCCYDGGFKDVTQSYGVEHGKSLLDVPGMLIFPEKHRSEVGLPPSLAGAEDDTGFVVQRDPEDGAIIADYCLFQLAECSSTLMIGDAGIANAFISEKDLRERNFARAWFTFDCS